MGGAYAVSMGNRGRIVVPREVRDRAGFTEGSPLILVETDSGVVLMTREQARSSLAKQLHGHDLVAELLAERRQSSRHEDGEL